MHRPVAKKTVEVGDVVVGDKEPVFCASVGEKDVFDLIEVAEEVSEEADLVELRIDMLDDSGIGEVERQLADNDISCPVILTIRKEEEGGNFRGHERERKELFLEYMAYVDAIDLEYHTPNQYREEIVQKTKENNMSLLFSYHNFSRTGGVEETKIRLEECLEIGDIAKVVTNTKSNKDVLNLFEATLQTKKNLKEPLTCFGMGEVGRHSRLVSVFYGSDIVYCAAKDPVAPGQFEIGEARELFSDLRGD